MAGSPREGGLEMGCGLPLASCLTLSSHWTVTAPLCVFLPARPMVNNLDSAEWQLVTANDRRTRSPATRRAQNLPCVLPRILRRKD